jgi:hypothetical protein
MRLEKSGPTPEAWAFGVMRIPLVGDHVGDLVVVPESLPGREAIPLLTPDLQETDR